MKAAVAVLGCLVACATTRGEDVVQGWHRVYQDTIRQTGGAPCPISRSGPMIALAMYDAVNAIDRAEAPNSAYEPYLADVGPVAPGTSRVAAAAAAAHRVMSALHGAGANPPDLDLQQQYDDRLALDVQGIPPEALQPGLDLGVAVADALMLARIEDGYDGPSDYTPGTDPGDWRPSVDTPDVPAFSPHWGACLPWGLESGDQFRPTRFDELFGGSMSALITSPEYADQLNGADGITGVKDFGERDSAVRSDEQTEIAWFWANDRDGTYKPPGHLIEITLVVSEQQGLDLSENARLFALVGLSLGDACIAAWDSKYKTPIDLWRPTDAVRETQDDGNPLTSPVDGWLPLNDFQPPFPAWVSGHATFGGAHAGIMAAYFGSDDIPFTVGSDEFVVNTALGYPPDLTRSFESFSQAGWENAMSRVFLGVHYQWDAEDGYNLGQQVAAYIHEHYLTPLCASDLTADGAVTSADLNQVLAGFGCEGQGCPGDINADGVTDAIDLNAVLEVFGGACP